MNRIVLVYPGVGGNGVRLTVVDVIPFPGVYGDVPPSDPISASVPFFHWL